MFCKLRNGECVIIKKIREYIKNNPGFGPIEEVADHTSLIEDGLLDSFSVVKLMMFIEKEFNIKIEVEDLTEENISTLNNIEKMIILKIEKNKSHG